MNFFDDLLAEVKQYLSAFSSKSYTPNAIWQDVGRNELILQRDAAYELDGAGFNIVTSNPIGDDEVIVIGNDIKYIKSNSKFARISVIQMNDVDDEQKAYDLIRKIEYAKYHLFPKGYMIRSSSLSHREIVRISKSAVKEDLSFDKVGTMLINKYKENKAVLAVKVIFVTDNNVDYKLLDTISKRNYDITETLNHIMNNVNFDCNSCKLKPVCDEVEGMRELHFKNAGKGM